MKRVFIAVKTELSESVLRVITSMKSGLSNESIKWTNPENLHITLLFLGKTEEEKVDIISSVLREVCNGFGEFEIIIRGVGVFKNMNEPRVIWAGIEPSEKLNILNKNIVNKLRNLDIYKGENYFKPHLTLGRIKSVVEKQNFKTIVDKYKTTELQNLIVHDVILYESILLPEGPVYKPIDIFSLR